jgi:hypothetical protein
MNRASRAAGAACALVGLSLAVAVVSLRPDARTAAQSCPVAGLARAAGTAARAFTLARCEDGWAMAAGLDGPVGDIAIFRQDHRRWVSDQGFALARLSTVGPAQFASAGISPDLLLQLARPFPPRVRQVTDAGALIEELAAHEIRLKAPGQYQASQVLRGDGGTWLALAGANSADNSSAGATASPYPDGTLSVYRWSAAGWSDQGTVRGWMGPISGCCGISAVSLTGSRDPDFAMTGGGAADTDWLSVVSDVGGRWHLVPFDYGYADTTVVNGEPSGHGVATEVDATSSAGGPTTQLFETYRGGAFQPATSPGPEPSCGRPGLQAAADAGRAPRVAFTASACADGWAIALGARAGARGQLVGLFNASRGRWDVVELDSGDSLGCDPGIYDIPLSLLRRLAAHFGPALQPELATAPLIAAPAMAGWTYVDGVITAGGAEWFIAERPTGTVSSVLPGATATVYRWSGSAWLRQGVVAHVPASLNYYLSARRDDVLSGEFEAVTVAGVAEPGFVLEGSGTSRPDVLTDAGGRWRVAGYR